MKKKPLKRVVDLDAKALGASIAGQLAREAFIRGVTLEKLAELAYVEPRVVLAFMLHPENADVGEIGRLSHALGLRYTIQAEPRP